LKAIGKNLSIEVETRTLAEVGEVLAAGGAEVAEEDILGVA